MVAELYHASATILTKNYLRYIIIVPTGNSIIKLVIVSRIRFSDDPAEGELIIIIIISINVKVEKNKLAIKDF